MEGEGQAVTDEILSNKAITSGFTINEKPPRSLTTLEVVGFVLSGGYFAAILIYAFTSSQPILALKADAFATFLSGVFAPVAFLWLVLGFKQQGIELQNSAKALYIQGEELRNSVEEQRRLVAISREQLEAEAKAREAAESAAEKAAQPVLTMGEPTKEEKEGFVEYSMPIRSGGPTISYVVVEKGDEPIAKFPFIMPGETVNFKWSLPYNVNQASFQVLIYYFDNRRNERRQYFWINNVNELDPNATEPMYEAGERMYL